MAWTKEERAAYQRAWLAKHPERREQLNKAAKARRRAAKGETGLASCQFHRSLGEPETPTEKHVVLSRLFRRLLQEGYDRGYLKIELTNDDTAYEVRVRAALDVSK